MTGFDDKAEDERAAVDELDLSDADDEDLERVECDLCHENIGTLSIVMVPSPDPDVPLLMTIHETCRPALVEGPVLGACSSCWAPMELSGPKVHECGGERTTWRARRASFVVHHPGYTEPLIGRCEYPTDPLNLPVYVRRVIAAFRSDKLRLPEYEVVKSDSEDPPFTRPVRVTWRMEPDADPPDDTLPALDRVCAECREPRPDYRGPDQHAHACPNCGSRLEPVPRP